MNVFYDMIKMVMKVAFVLLVAVTSCQTLDEKKATKQTDAIEDAAKANEVKTFVGAALQNNLAAIQISEAAEKKATLPKVQEFAANVHIDFDNQLTALKELALHKNIEIKGEKSSVATAELNQMVLLKGITFDEAYVNWIIVNHGAVIDRYRNEAQNGKDIETKAYAANKLPILIHHLDMAKTLYASMKTN